MLVLDQRRRDLPARQAHREVVAEAEEHVVPARRDRDERQLREIPMLIGEERAHPRLVDIDLRDWLGVRWHRIAMIRFRR